MLKRIPFQLIRHITRIGLMAGYYHMVSDDDVVHVKHLYEYKSVSGFSNDVDFLLRSFNPVSLEDVLNYAKKGEALPPRAFLLTFDDGFSHMYDVVAPLLLRKGVPAVYFLNSACIDNANMCHQQKVSIVAERLPSHDRGPLWEYIAEIMNMHHRSMADMKKAIINMEYGLRQRIDEIAGLMGIDFNEYLREVRPYLSSSQIRDLIRNGFAVGSHSIDHPRYSALPIEEQITQTVESTRFVRDTFGLNYGAFAFPHSDSGVSQRFFNELSDKGCVDITFGTGGMRYDGTAFHVQRFSLERPAVPARDIIALESSKKIGRMIRGSDRVERM